MFIQLNGRRLHYELNNCASADPERTVVLIHGLGQNLRTWDPLIPYLSHYRILRYDIGGHGASDAPETGYHHLHIFSDELLALLNYLNIRKAILFGYELGACIATHFSGQYPEYASRLITASHPVYYPDEIRKKKYKQRLNELKRIGLPRFAARCLTDITMHTDADFLAHAYSQVSIETYEAIIQMLDNSSLLHDYSLVAQPVLHLIGERDTLYPPEMLLQAIRYFYPPPILMMVPNAKSLVHVDNPEYTAQRIDAFVRTEMNQTAPLAKEASTYYTTYTSLLHKRKQDSPVSHQLRIDVMHQFEARINGHLLQGNWKVRKAQELIIYLIYNKVAMREKLYDLFWPHLNLENAQNMLRVSVNHLKKLIDKPFGTSFVISSRDRIELTGEVESDLLDLLGEIQRFHACENHDEKEMIARRIGHTFTSSILEGYYNDWIMSLREELINSAAPIIKWVAQRYESRNQLMDSIMFYKLMLQMLPEEIELNQKIAGLYDDLQLKGLAREWQERYWRALNGEDY